MKDTKVLDAILLEMRNTVIGGLVSAQIGKTTLEEITKDASPAFDQYSKEDIVKAFIGFAMNVAVHQLEQQGNEEVKTTSEETPMSKGGQA